MEKIYLVRHCGGSYEDSWDNVIFATNKRATAIKYVKKYNGILKKWSQYYSQFEQSDMPFNWIKEQHVKKHFKRWYALRGINKCYYQETNIR
jgi:hypothetical protein